MKARSFYHMRTRQTLERGSHKPRGIKDRQESTERQRKVLPQSLPWEHSPATSLISGSRRQNHKTGDVLSKALSVVICSGNPRKLRALVPASGVLL